MTRPLRAALFVGIGLLALAVILGGVALFLVRRALSPEKIRPVAEAKLSSALGKPVKLGTMSVGLFPVPSLRAEGVFVGEEGKAAPSLAIASLRVVPSLSSLLHGTLVVDHVDLVGIDVAVRRNKKGEWSLPYDPPKETTKPAAESAAPVTVKELRIREGRFRLVDDLPPGGGPAREVAALEEIEGRISVEGGRTVVEELTATLLKTQLTGSAQISAEGTTLSLASPSISSADIPQIFAFLGAAPIDGLSISGSAPFSMKMDIPSGKGSLSANGEFDAATLKLGTMTVTGLKTPFRVEKNTATLSPLTFTAYKGKQKGSVTLFVSRDPMGYTVKTHLEGLDVNEALSANTSAKDVLLGTANVSGTVKGAGFDEGSLKSRLSGNAVVAVRDGVLRDIALLAKINQALKVTAGDEKDTRFESLDASFVIGSGKAHTEDLALKAGELTVLAKGDVNFDLTLDFKGTARFAPAKTAEILHSLSDLRRLVNDRGELELPLTVKGPVSDPSVGVDLAAAAKKAVKEEFKQQIGDKLKSLFGK